MLGETVTGVVSGLAAEPVSVSGIAVALVSVVVGFGAWWTYFDFAGHREPQRTPAATVRWMLAHLPLTAAVAAMGAAMISLVEHAHAARTPAATAWMLCGSAAVVLLSTMLVATGLEAWHSKPGLYRPLSRTSGAAAVACLGLGAARPAPIVLGLVPVVLFSVTWGVAVSYRLRQSDPAGE